jgi:hypothetical protein
MKKIRDCVEEGKVGNEFSRKEEGKRFTIKAKKPFWCEVIKMDGCVFNEKDGLKKCDYLFLTHRQNEDRRPFKAVYVELKGNDVKRACEQLYKAVFHTKSQVVQYEIVAKVVATKVSHPNLKGNEYYRDLRKLIKKDIQFHKVHKGNNFHYCETIDN